MGQLDFIKSELIWLKQCLNEAKKRQDFQAMSRHGIRLKISYKAYLKLKEQYDNITLLMAA